MVDDGYWLLMVDDDDDDGCDDHTRHMEYKYPRPNII
jgi:hypothetical protein